MSDFRSINARERVKAIFGTLIAHTHIGHRVSIYADDVVIFSKPQQQEINLIKGILDVFGEASGLRANKQKSSIMPICCTEEDKQRLHSIMACDISEFLCKYLGLPLSLRRLTKTDLQPYLDKIADALPAWKASLMVTSGRLVLVRAVLTAIPLHLLITLDVPKWFVKVSKVKTNGTTWHREICHRQVGSM